MTNNFIYKENESIINLFQQYGQRHFFKKGSYVFTKGESPKAVYYIEEGLLKVCQHTALGQNITFFIRKTNDAFGLAEIILQRNHPCYAQCLLDCTILLLDAEIIKEEMSKNLNVNNDLLYTMTSRLIHQQSTVELLSTKSVTGRLAWFLHEIATKMDHQFIVKMLLTHEEISNIIGSSRQTVTEILNRWRSEGKIMYDRSTLVIKDESIFLED